MEDLMGGFKLYIQNAQHNSCNVFLQYLTLYKKPESSNTSSMYRMEAKLKRTCLVSDVQIITERTAYLSVKYTTCIFLV